MFYCCSGGLLADSVMELFPSTSDSIFVVYTKIIRAMCKNSSALISDIQMQQQKFIINS